METPFKRDVVKELCEAGRKRGLHVSPLFLPSRLVRRGLPALCRRSGGRFRPSAELDPDYGVLSRRVEESHVDDRLIRLRSK